MKEEKNENNKKNEECIATNYLLVQVHDKRFVNRISFAEENINSKLYPYVWNIRWVKQNPKINTVVPELHEFQSKNITINTEKE